jgi:hypothetical protein
LSRTDSQQQGRRILLGFDLDGRVSIICLSSVELERRRKRGFGCGKAQRRSDFGEVPHWDTFRGDFV